MGGTALLDRPVPSGTRNGDRRERWLLPALLAVWGAALGAVLFAVAYRAIPDDGLITAAFARNVAEHGCWCLTAGIEANTATSPLHVWLLAVVTWVAGHPLWALAAVLMASLAAVAVWVRDLAGIPAGVLAPLLLASSPVFASAVGMETFLVAAVLVGVVRFAARRRWAVAGAFVGLAWLARPDVLIPAAVAYTVLAVTARTWRAWRGAPVAAIVVAPWTVFSWMHFGSAWANSATVKWANGAWNGATITDWSFFYSQWPAVTIVTATTMGLGVAAGLVALATRMWSAVAFAAAGTAHLAALSIATTPPIFYYLGPSLGCFTVTMVLVASRTRVALFVPVAVAAACVAVLVGNGAWWDRGIAPIRQNWGTDQQYAAIAAGLPRDGWVLGGEIGGLAYYCADHGCKVVDPVLSDPGRTDVLVAKWRREHPTLSAINYRNYQPPAPIPVTYRLRFGAAEPGPGPSWPITRNPGIDQWAVLEVAPDPLQQAN